MIRTNRECDRRAFLMKSTKWSAAVCFSYCMPASIISCSNSQQLDDSPEYYYTSRKTNLLRDYDKAVGPGREVVVKSLGGSLAGEVLLDGRKEYEAIIPEIPYIGGEQNDNSTSQLLAAAQSLALYRVLVANGKGIEEIGQVIYDMFEAMLRKTQVNLPPGLET